ncbi:hypothetical protein EZV62_005192 [Acer yangbiense]|uniref:PsbP C-terminal domain-containing protein n=1 Tax=Acer yangbiense TaxID=1000413 RepID=A0A5C7ILH1_9ROSI|nr:hypothetical protein EZV62_005192 [Acer yangbiense]
MAATASLTQLSPIFSASKSPKQASIKTKVGTFHQNRNGFSLRRQILKGLAIFPLTSTTLLEQPLSSQAREVEVGSYLPPSPSDPSFVLFKASPKDTPALRAGAFLFIFIFIYVFVFRLLFSATILFSLSLHGFINRLTYDEYFIYALINFLAGNVQPYQFVLPPTWKQTRIANILSGNYCQPKCAEPWVEVRFEDEKQGKIQVVASPLIRLTNRPNATIEEIGSPEKLIASLGPFVTGNSYDPDELLETSVEKVGDQTYYKYVLETPFALTGTHNLAKVTAKGSTVVLFVASANDKQWPASQKVLKAMLDSFQV